MMSRRRALETALGALVAGLAGQTPGATAQTSKTQPVTRTEIFRHALPNVRGKEVIVISIEYAPGSGSTRHRHPGPVFAYVVRGAVVSQLGGDAPVTYGEGEMWYEPPGALHSVSRNASETDGAKLIAFFVADQNQILTEPVSN